MKIDKAMFCPQCNEVFSFEPSTNGIKKISPSDCPDCCNKMTLFISNFILGENLPTEIKDRSNLYLKYKV
jgi:hypothetical protein